MKGGCDFRELQEFAKKLEKIGKQENIDKLYKECAFKLAQMLLRRLKLNSPVKSGELRRNWQITNIVKNGGTYCITALNPTPYASYVNYGHRTRLKKGWVEGQFFLELSVAEVERAMPAFLNRRLDEYVRECFNDN